eukprot:gene29179-32402_t
MGLARDRLVTALSVIVLNCEPCRATSNDLANPNATASLHLRKTLREGYNYQTLKRNVLGDVTSTVVNEPSSSAWVDKEHLWYALVGECLSSYRGGHIVLEALAQCDLGARTCILWRSVATVFNALKGLQTLPKQHKQCWLLLSRLNKYWTTRKGARRWTLAPKHILDSGGYTRVRNLLHSGVQHAASSFISSPNDEPVLHDVPGLQGAFAELCQLRLGNYPELEDPMDPTEPHMELDGNYPELEYPMDPTEPHMELDGNYPELEDPMDPTEPHMELDGNYPELEDPMDPTEPHMELDGNYPELEDPMDPTEPHMELDGNYPQLEDPMDPTEPHMELEKAYKEGKLTCLDEEQSQFCFLQILPGELNEPAIIEFLCKKDSHHPSSMALTVALPVDTMVPFIRAWARLVTAAWTAPTDGRVVIHAKCKGKKAIKESRQRKCCKRLYHTSDQMVVWYSQAATDYHTCCKRLYQTSD